MLNAVEIIARATEAARAFRGFDQAATDRVVRAAYLAALDARIALAKEAHEETGLGRWQDKVLKNVIASQLVYEDIRTQRTVGVIAEDSVRGIVELARPVGPILGFVPMTNPTSTTIFKSLIALKTRNPLILSPPQAARHCTGSAARICYEAARAAGAPEHCIQWLERPRDALLSELMADPALALILATGTASVVRKAARSGTPVIGVGPGNVPVYIGATADIPFAVEQIMLSKTLDHGTVCASEQALVVKREVEPRLVAELERQGAVFLTPAEREQVARIAFDPSRGAMSPLIVGQSAESIARSAGFAVAPGTKLLIARLDGIGREHPLSAEILAPILAFYVEDDFDAAIDRCSEITRYGGVGHTAVIYSNNQERIAHFANRVEASRILTNTPATHGALGGMFNTLSPSFTLSCGAGGNNITTDNITARHLLNIHRIARRRPNPHFASMDQARYLDESTDALALETAFGRNL
jgi:acetaldehyde dehydrogenase/alcohol dehydrogenase